MKTSEKTKGTIFLLMLVACFMLSTSSSKIIAKRGTNQVGGTAYITVCHQGRGLTIKATDLQYHLRHGDHLGDCRYSN